MKLPKDFDLRIAETAYIERDCFTPGYEIRWREWRKTVALSLPKGWQFR